MTQSTPPGWYPDGQGGQRWWDGNQWTEHTLPPSGGERPEPPAQQPAQAGHSDPTQVRPGGPPAQEQPGQQQEHQQAYPAQHQQQGYPGQYQQQQGYPGQHQQQGYPGQQQGYPGQPGQQAWQGQQYGGGTGGGVNTKLLAIIGGGAVAVLAVVIILVVVLGGGSGGPKGVVEDFVNADSCGDAEDLVTDDFFGEGGCDDSQLSPTGEQEEADVEHDIGDEKVDGDKATVPVTTTVEFQGEEQEFETTFRLVKEDGDWKIDGVE